MSLRFGQFLEEPFRDGAPVDVAFVSLTEAGGAADGSSLLCGLQVVGSCAKWGTIVDNEALTWALLSTDAPDQGTAASIGW